MKKLLLFMIVPIAVFSQSCVNHPSKGPQLLSAQTFSFTAPVDPSTLSEAQAISLYSDPTLTRSSTYVISTPEELTAFSQITGTAGSDANYQNVFNNLDVHTYLLIMGPTCPDYLKYSGYQSKPPSILILMNHFIVYDALCPAINNDTYYVLKGNK